MVNQKTKFEYYDILKKLLEAEQIMVHEYSEISYGLQFTIEMDSVRYRIRVFESKKHGVRADFSQIKDADVVFILSKIAQPIENSRFKKEKTDEKDEKRTVDNEYGSLADIDENPIIGTDESGKGDYFGPLVIAGVYADPLSKSILRELGVADSKKLSDVRIAKLASEIKNVCKYSIVSIGNPRYNELYDKFKNLNRLLAWGHARVIENILEETACAIALSDQFGSKDLIERALMDKGRQIHLEQRPRAEQNIVVAAASILARNEFVEKIKEISSEYGIEFPMGASNINIHIGRSFIKKYGEEHLSSVAKLHFKTTKELG